jgi:hypothetical protein
LVRTLVVSDSNAANGTALSKAGEASHSP